MSGRIEYLEKYSVAASPSRDYYGLKVLRDEVVLHLWKISHGPHKTPLVRAVKFIDFEEDKSLHDEISRAFGEHLLKYVRNVVRGGGKTLLTLPKDLIVRLLRYLSINDVVTLSSLSHVANEIFGNNSVWKIFYKRYKATKSNSFDRYYDLSYGWKRLFKEERMQRKNALAFEQKNPKVRSASMLTRTKVGKQDLTNRYISTSKKSSKINVFANDLSERLETPQEKGSKSVVSDKSSDIRLTGISISEKPGTDPTKKSLSTKSLQNVNQKNVKTLRKGALALKKPIPPTNDKRTTKVVKDSAYNKPIEPKLAKGQETPARSGPRSKTSSGGVNRSENNANASKQKGSKTSPSPKAEKTDQNKSRVKNKPKKLGQSKSSILSTHAALLADSKPVGESGFDLADLIEASLKNARSPRSIFDYDFSCLQDLKSCAGDVRNADGPRGIRGVRGKMMLERLSERSETSTARSADGLGRKTVGADGNDRLDDSSFVEAYGKNDAVETKKCSALNLRSREPAGNETGHLERYGIYNKYPAARLRDQVDKTESETRTPLDRMSLLRSLKLSNLSQDTSLASRESSGTVSRNRYNS